MNTLRSAICLFLAAAPTMAFAQQAPMPATPPAQDRSTQIQSEGGPVTVTWGQPAAVPNASDYQVTITALDKNGDGVLTRGEVPATHALSSEFKRVDRNRDGRITEAELAAWR